MKSLRRVALVALVLVSAVVVVASPAFATPRLTTSTGTAARPDNSAVSPFATPIGDTLTSSVTITNVYARVAGARAGSSLAVFNGSGVADGFTCLRITGSGEIGLTHTRTRIYSLDFLGCREDVNGLVVHIIVNHISSSNPFFIHITSTVAGDTTSWNGVFEIPTGSGITLIFKVGNVDICTMTVGPQSVRVFLTTRGKTIAVNRSPVSFSLNIPNPGGTSCPDASRPFSITSTTNITWTTDTPATNPTITPFSTP